MIKLWIDQRVPFSGIDVFIIVINGIVNLSHVVWFDNIYNSNYDTKIGMDFLDKGFKV